MSEDAHDIRVKIIYSGSYINDLGIVTGPPSFSDYIGSLVFCHVDGS